MQTSCIRIGIPRRTIRTDTETCLYIYIYIRDRKGFRHHRWHVEPPCTEARGKNSVQMKSRPGTDGYLPALLNTRSNVLSKLDELWTWNFCQALLCYSFLRLVVLSFFLG